MTQRLVKHPFMAIFDGPDTNASTDLRPRSTVPLQALYLRNNPFVHEQAAGFADRLIARSRRRSSEDRGGRTSWRGGARPSRTKSSGLRYLSRLQAGPRRQRSVREPTIERLAWSSLAKVMLTSNEFLYVD